jgi:hypothetical protein
MPALLVNRLPVSLLVKEAINELNRHLAALSEKEEKEIETID